MFQSSFNDYIIASILFTFIKMYFHSCLVKAAVSASFTCFLLYILKCRQRYDFFTYEFLVLA